MAEQSNGIPTNCFNDPEVEWITVRLPVYVGTVDVKGPSHIDKLAFNILGVEQRRGLNRVVEGYKRVYPTPALAMTRPLIARWVFTQIDKAFEDREVKTS